MESTKVKCRCIKKSQSQIYDQNNPVRFEIELQPPYDEKSIYYQLSGGTNFVLRTINQAAAEMFEAGKDYDVVISPSVE